MSSGEYLYAVFTPNRDHWWTRFMHPEYQHCYLIKADNGRWIVYGKCMNGLELETIDDFSIPSNGMIVVKAKADDSTRGLLMFNTCVGHIKQALGIRNPFILTPYQLYKHLRKL